MADSGGGNSNALGIIIIVVLAFVTFTGIGKDRVQTNNVSESSKQESIKGNTRSTPAGSTPDANAPTREATLGTGNAKSAYQTFKEYVIITPRSKEPVNITNWMLRNGKDKRVYYQGEQLRVFPADIAFIPQGTRFISPTGHNVIQDIVLVRGESAIITTGKIGTTIPYKIVSFKENICSGYLESLPEYSFTPPLRRSCPRPSEESGQQYLDTGCKNFVERLPSCQTPDFTPLDKEGEQCTNCVNRTLLSRTCVAYIKSHFSYAGCIANHLNDPDFEGKRWRVFLNLPWEMWAKEDEVIELFDRSGKLVDKKEY